MQGFRFRRVFLIHIPTRILIQIDEAPAGWPKMNKDGQSVFFEVWLIISTQQFEQIHFSGMFK